MMKDFSALKPMNSEFDFFFGSDFFRWPEKSLELKAGRICEFKQDQSEYHFSFQVPGIDRRDVSIDVAANTLIVRGKRSGRGARPRYFEKFFLVPQDADIEHIEAKLVDSSLTLKIPRCSDTSWNDIAPQAPRQ